METQTILTDERQILEITYQDGYFKVGVGITKIMAYGELGQGNYVPWFALFVGDQLVARVNGMYVTLVTYFTT